MYAVAICYKDGRGCAKARIIEAQMKRVHDRARRALRPAHTTRQVRVYESKGGVLLRAPPT